MSAGNDREFIDFQQSKEKGGRPMKCPLLPTPIKIGIGELTGERADCLKEECAWWNSHTEECVTMSIGRILNHMSDSIYGIRDKMPHEEQFRR
ncbi:unnamed protein product [marine sediment metagenome]|uniref:Uncharacterized protein n=1 Tax=marine sediment metagenome TaxID=412755 RepID=X1N083_9ZZZZ